MVRWHQWLNRHECELTPGDGEEQGSLLCCSPWSHRVRHNLVTEQQQHSFIHFPVLFVFKSTLKHCVLSQGPIVPIPYQVHLLWLCIISLVLRSLWTSFAFSTSSFYRWRSWSSKRVGGMPSTRHQSLERVQLRASLLFPLSTAIPFTLRCFQSLEMTSLYLAQF